MKNYETFSSKQDSEIDLKPFINFLVVLIPVLMISAEFSKIAIVEASSCTNGSTTDSSAAYGRIPPDRKTLGLAILVTDSTMTLGSNNGFLPTINYREYHTYVARGNRTQRITVCYDSRNPKRPVMNPTNGKPFGVDERETIGLYVLDENHQIVQCLYAKNNGMVTDANGAALKAVGKGDSVYIVVGPDRTMTTVDRPADFSLKPLSAYDLLRSDLAIIRARAGAVSDRRSIRIAAESSVIYDKIIQLMDIARAGDFPDISIAKFRG
jgi:biopolymer transport protein ExbD